MDDSPFETLLEERYAGRREPTIPGVLTAIVTGRMADGTYELDYLSMGDGTPSAPARVMAPTAGAGRGSWTMPEVGDEVVVAFDAGDTNNPIILGAVWNDRSPPPDAAEPSDDNPIRTFVSRSGHQLTFDDRPAGGKVRVRTAGGRELLLDDTEPGRVTLSGASGITIELDEDADTLTLRSPGAIVLESQSITLTASASGLSSSVTLEKGGIALKSATGNPAISLVTIDGRPFGLHTHNLPPAPPTGPVTP